jgi:hypothetical protein
MKIGAGSERYSRSAFKAGMRAPRDFPLKAVSRA